MVLIINLPLDIIPLKLNTVREPQRIANILAGEVFAVFFDEALDRGDSIRSVKGYVGASINNMTSGSVSPK